MHKHTDDEKMQMIERPYEDVREKFDEIKELCRNSATPIRLKTPWAMQLYVMNLQVYDKLAANYEMFNVGIRLDQYDLTAYKEKLQIYCEETDEPVFIWVDDGNALVFMSAVLYNFLAGKPQEYEDDKLKITVRRKRNMPLKRATTRRGEIIPFNEFHNNMDRK